MGTQKLKSEQLASLACLALVGVGCATNANRLYSRGVEAYGRGDWSTASDHFGSFSSEFCGFPPKPDPRCQSARSYHGRALVRQGQFARAWVELSRPMAGPVLAGSETLTAAELRTVRESHLEKIRQTAEHGATEIRYKNDLPKTFELKSCLIRLDFEILFEVDSKQRSALLDGLEPVFSGDLTAGEHVLEVRTRHICHPSPTTGNCGEVGIVFMSFVEIKPNRRNVVEVRVAYGGGTFYVLPQPGIKIVVH